MLIDSEVKIHLHYILRNKIFIIQKLRFLKIIIQLLEEFDLFIIYYFTILLFTIYIIILYYHQYLTYFILILGNTISIYYPKKSIIFINPMIHLIFVFHFHLQNLLANIEFHFSIHLIILNIYIDLLQVLNRNIIYYYLLYMNLI